MSSNPGGSSANEFITLHRIRFTIKRGDLLEINRGQFKHWAMYIGDGDVIHVVPDNSVSLLPFAEETTAPVRRDRLEDVVNGDPVRVNNDYEEYPTKTLHEVLESALRMVDERVPYNVWEKNCEYYVKQWKYDKGVSEQAERGELALTGGELLFGAALLGGALLAHALSSPSKRNRNT